MDDTTQQRDDAEDPVLSEAQRFDFISKVSYTIEPMLDGVQHAVLNDSDPDRLRYYLLGLLPRLHQMNLAIMSAASGCRKSDIDQTGLLVTLP